MKTMTLAVVMLALTAAASSPAAQPQRSVPSLGGGMFSVIVQADCTLKLNPGGSFPFPAIGTLGGNPPEHTAENDAVVSCGGRGGQDCELEDDGCAKLSITDSSLTGTTQYNLATGKNRVHYQICATASGSGCYRNSASGFTVGGKSTTKMFGYLPTQGRTASGKYSDTVTVTLCFD